MKRLGVLCVGVLVLAGCSGAPEVVPESAPSTPTGPVVTGLGVYSYEVSGALGVVTLPGTADVVLSDAVALANAPVPVYLSLAVDNRKGASPQWPAAVTAYTVAGSKVVYVAASKYLNGLDTSALSIPDDNKIVAAYNKLNDPVTVGESRTVTMVGTEPLPADIVRVTVSDAHGGEVEAVKK